MWCTQISAEQLRRIFTSPCFVARCIWESMLGVQGLRSQRGGRSFSSKPTLTHVLCWVLVTQADVEKTDQKRSATQCTANKALHSAPAGQWIFCPIFACSCKWFIKNCSIFLVSFRTLNGQIFFTCNSVLDSLHPFALFPVCTVMKAECCVLEMKRALKLSNVAQAVVVLRVLMCVTCLNTTRKCAWVFCLPHFIGREAKT